MICNYYLPGYKGGGGLRSLAHTVERFGDRFDFRIITRDSDSDGTVYTNIKANDWNEIKKAQVYYLSKDNVGISKLREVISEVEPDLIYLNSVFSTLTVFYLVLRKLKRIPAYKTVLAPEGELSDGALKLKSYKKKPYAALAKSAGLYRDLIWKTTAEPESEETKRFKGRGGEIYIAPNLPSLRLVKDYRSELKPPKTKGAAKLIFLSRYVKKKNFKWLVENLKGVKGNLTIDVYGPLEDAPYWEATKKLFAELPANIEIEYRGLLEYEKVFGKLAEYHFFILPTLGENFGHVFIEALAAGCPLLTSDRTPWRDLEKKNIGWDLPLEKPAQWIEKLNYCIGLDQKSYSDLSNSARSYAVEWLSSPKIEEDTLRVLEKSVGSR